MGKRSPFSRLSTQTQRCAQIWLFSKCVTSPALVWELMVILQEPPPWQYTVVVISSRVRRACISSWEGTNSLVFVLFRESLMNCAYLSISEPGKRSFTLIVKRSKKSHYTVKQKTSLLPCNLEYCRQGIQQRCQTQTPQE